MHVQLPDRPADLQNTYQMDFHMASCLHACYYDYVYIQDLNSSLIFSIVTHLGVLGLHKLACSFHGLLLHAVIFNWNPGKHFTMFGRGLLFL